MPTPQALAKLDEQFKKLEETFPGKFLASITIPFQTILSLSKLVISST